MKWPPKKTLNSGAMWSPKKAFHVNLGAIIFKSKHVGRHFCSDFQGVLDGSQRYCPDFRGFCPDWMRFCPDFHQIKTFEGAVLPPATRLLHQLSATWQHLFNIFHLIWSLKRYCWTWWDWEKRLVESQLKVHSTKL